MKDTILLASFVAVIAWVATSDWKSLTPPPKSQSFYGQLGVTHESPENGDVSQDNGSRATRYQHQETANQVSKLGHSQKEDSTTRDELQRLSSIYRKKKQVSTTTKKTPRKNKKNLFGVPVNDWVLAHQDTIQGTDLPVHEKEGIRVFLMCSEVSSKQVKNLNKSQCRGLMKQSSYGGIAYTEE